MSVLYDIFLKGIQQLTNTEWQPDVQLRNAAMGFCSAVEQNGMPSNDAVLNAMLEATNNKLDCGKAIYRRILDTAFREGVVLNYWDKLDIRNLVNAGDATGFNSLINKKPNASQKLLNSFVKIPREETERSLSFIKESDSKWEEILSSIFARAVFMIAGESFARSYFSSTRCAGSHDSFFSYVDELYPGRVQRALGLSIIEIDPDMFEFGYERGCNRALKAICQAYNELGNHTDLCILIPPMFHGEDLQWRLFSDVVLFAEKGKLEDINRMYFRKKVIREVTEQYVNGIDDSRAKFDLAATGFVFKDCFVLTVDNDIEGYWLLLVFEKNVRDERPVPCPACYSSDVEGNSYPILNVKSWECRNPLCPDRSKYNRGKRYALSSMVRQSHIGNESDRIPKESIAKWHLDCLSIESISEAYEMAIRHYSFSNDNVLIFGGQNISPISRKVIYAPFPECEENILEGFKSGPYFERYEHDAPGFNNSERAASEVMRWHIGKATIINAEARQFLAAQPEGSFDCAVTSPPYYNAKDYSQWPNIYCYLYDMRNIAKEVYRVLKQGGVFLYNVFDYFDNERNVVFSAMGDKRMILGAYAIDSFKRIGFNLLGNIVWNKGEIQGNRSFNQGNESPYYQSPLNCWEHILVFSKGKPNEEFSSLKSRVEHFHPFVKIVRGKNILGHDAPFPEDVPNLVVELMREDETVLDPFGGSCTTGLAASRKGIRSVCIEQMSEYCELGRNRLGGLEKHR